jgi:nitroimidazol reductase NimA-like FMN-containing flavoprotein (pyridoxamine 5'-phosphate oxidase superfamily)
VMDPSPDQRLEDLSTSTCWALLRDVPIGRIALPGDGDVEVFPVNFVVDGGTIVLRTAAGTKLSLIAAGSRATFEVDEVDVVEQTAWSVVLKGMVQVVIGHDAVIETFEMEVQTWQAGQKPTYVRLVPDSVSGRRFPITLS